jgi:hypothetical protein
MCLNIESAIARINHVIVLPGFGFDHQNCYVYYRLSIPRREDNSLSVAELENLVQTCIITGTEFHELLSEVAIGSISANEIVKVAKKMDGNRQFHQNVK